MQNDTAIVVQIEHKENVLAYINQKYLNGYLARFESSVYVFPTDDSLAVTDGKTFSYFQQMADNGKPTFGRNLVFLSSENGRSSYLAFVPMGILIHRNILWLF
ncbi:MAG: hypothetical protein IPI62_16115 [Bacteroidetes bacterium]|nr:hypothetical protein [Bacteroidota bacterium]